jgi:hypothetical protein
MTANRLAVAVENKPSIREDVSPSISPAAGRTRARAIFMSYKNGNEVEQACKPEPPLAIRPTPMPLQILRQESMDMSASHLLSPDDAVPTPGRRSKR